MSRKKYPIQIRYLKQKDWFQVSFCMCPGPWPSRNYHGLNTLMGFLEDYFECKRQPTTGTEKAATPALPTSNTGAGGSKPLPKPKNHRRREK